MTIRSVVRRETPPLVWLDVVAPTRDELDEAARCYDLHATTVADCLDPEHLPKYERFPHAAFVIVRAHDERSSAAAATVQEITRKVALFVGPDFVVTIHRKDQPYLTALQETVAARAADGGGPPVGVAEIVAGVINGAVDSYLAPLEQIETGVDAFEAALFEGRGDISTMLREIYLLKRRVTLIKRMLWHVYTVTQRLVPGTEAAAPLLRDAEENAQSMHFYADELLEDVTTLLSVQLAMASHRTNQVMRVLTVFSAFFLPLTFIVGVYGMNFAHMPELAARWGYPAVWMVMLAVTTAIFLWFRRRGWLRA